jgi:hypothetical protein
MCPLTMPPSLRMAWSMINVEARRQGNLIDLMAEMRDWLDAQRIVPELFQYSASDGVITFQVGFGSANEATAFAVFFDGRVVPNEVTA